MTSGMKTIIYPVKDIAAAKRIYGKLVGETPYADEAYYVLEGELEVLAGEHTFTARAGSYVQIPQGTLHRFQNVGNRASRMLVLLTPAGFEDFLFEVGQPARPGESPPPLGPEELERTIAAAPKHHLELRLPGTA